jgi:hypothetical protein
MVRVGKQAATASPEAAATPACGDRLLVGFSDLDSLAGLLRRESDAGVFDLARSDKGERGGAHQS